MSSVWKRLQRVNKHAAKFQLVASYRELMVTGSKKWQPHKLLVIWTRRGRRVASQARSWEPTIRDPYRGRVVWPVPENVEVSVTLFRDPNSNVFEDKDWSFVVEDISAQGKRRHIAVGVVNVAKFARPEPTQTEVVLHMRPLTPKCTEAQLLLTLSCSFLREGKATDEDMQSIASLLSAAPLAAPDYANLEDFEEEASPQASAQLSRLAADCSSLLSAGDSSPTPSPVITDNDLDLSLRSPSAAVMVVQPPPPPPEPPETDKNLSEQAEAMAESREAPSDPGEDLLTWSQRMTDGYEGGQGDQPDHLVAQRHGLLRSHTPLPPRAHRHGLPVASRHRRQLQEGVRGGGVPRSFPAPGSGRHGAPDGAGQTRCGHVLAPAAAAADRTPELQRPLHETARPSPISSAVNDEAASTPAEAITNPEPASTPVSVETQKAVPEKPETRVPCRVLDLSPTRQPSPPDALVSPLIDPKKRPSSRLVELQERARKLLEEARQPPAGRELSPGSLEERQHQEQLRERARRIIAQARQGHHHHNNNNNVSEPSTPDTPGAQTANGLKESAEDGASREDLKARQTPSWSVRLSEGSSLRPARFHQFQKRRIGGK
ncbi:hypothetical protein MTO96_002441 [Rhipicephalus appendiculatus]